MGVVSMTVNDNAEIASLKMGFQFMQDMLREVRTDMKEALRRLERVESDLEEMRGARHQSRAFLTLLITGAAACGGLAGAVAQWWHK